MPYDDTSEALDELMPSHAATADVLVIGAGAAGLAAMIFTARFGGHLRLRCLDGAHRIGAKILVSGGSRCNVTNRVVTEHDFWGGSSRVVTRVLRAFSARTRAAVLRRARRRAARRGGRQAVSRQPTGRAPCSTRCSPRRVATRRAIETRRACAGRAHRRRTASVAATEPNREYRARRLVLATGGRSLPKTGSDGFGYELARRLGHGYVHTDAGAGAAGPRGETASRLTGVSHRGGDSRSSRRRTTRHRSRAAALDPLRRQRSRWC